MSSFLEEIVRRRVISAVCVFILSILLLLHNPGFPLALIPICSGVYLLANTLRLRRIRAERAGGVSV